jgi:hypothetical protein
MLPGLFTINQARCAFLHRLESEIFLAVPDKPTIELEALLETALRSSAPRSQLQRVMAYLLEQGLEREEIFALLEGCRARLLAERRTADEDLLEEMQDGFTGWCAM